MQVNLRLVATPFRNKHPGNATTDLNLFQAGVNWLDSQYCYCLACIVLVRLLAA